MNIFNKFRLYSEYKKSINRNRKILLEEYKVEKDYINRLYTTVDFDPSEFKEIKNYGYKYTDEEITRKIKDLDKFFRKIGIFELIEIESIDQRNPLSYGIIFKYKFLNTKKLYFIKLFSILALIIGVLTLIIL